MKRILVSDKEAENLAKRERRRLESYKRRHLKKKRSYVNDKKLGAIMKHLQISYSYILYTIKFKSPLSLYLFLYLKNRAYTTKVPEIYNLPAMYSTKFFSFPVEVRFSKMAKELGFTRNSVKYAYRELLDIGLIQDTTEEILPEHLSAKTCIVFNDENILYFDSQKRKVCYSIQSKPKSTTVKDYRSIDFDSVKR